MDEVDSNDKLLAALAYIFTPLVPIIITLMEDKKDRPFIKAHNAQALVLGIIEVILVVLTPFGCVTGIVAFFLWLALLYWAYQAYQGEEVVIPVVTDFVKNQGWA